MLSKEKIEKYKNTLEGMKESLEDEIAHLETPVDMGDFPGEDENTDESEQAFNQRSSASSLRDELDEVESALIKIQKGNYGKCESCGQEIEEEILDISPESKFCRECNKKNINKK